MTNNPAMRIFNKVKHRRVDKVSQLVHATKVSNNVPVLHRMKLIDWIGDNTQGRFWIGFNEIYFEMESDAIIYKLGFKI